MSYPTALNRLLAECATVEEAIHWLAQSTNVVINGSSSKLWFPSLAGATYRNSGIGGHFLIADRAGNSIVCEWEKGQPSIIRKTGRYQLITNFLLLHPERGNYPCSRFADLSGILEKTEKPTVDDLARALKTASTGLTRYSQVYDLQKGEVYVYVDRHFRQTVKVNLAAELHKGRHEARLETMVAVNDDDDLLP